MLGVDFYAAQSADEIARVDADPTGVLGGLVLPDVRDAVALKSLQWEGKYHDDSPQYLFLRKLLASLDPKKAEPATHSLAAFLLDAAAFLSKGCDVDSQPKISAEISYCGSDKTIHQITMVAKPGHGCFSSPRRTCLLVHEAKPDEGDLLALSQLAGEAWCAAAADYVGGAWRLADVQARLSTVCGCWAHDSHSLNSSSLSHSWVAPLQLAWLAA